MLAVLLFCIAALPKFAHPQTVEANTDHPGGMLHPAAGRPSFEVAVIRQSAPNADLDVLVMHPGSFEARGTTLKDLILFAYAVPDEKELSGGMGWINKERFDVTAKPEQSDIPALKALPPTKLHDQMRLRLQVLLEQRFKLQVSFAKKALPLLTLEVAKGGLRCKRVATDNAASFDNSAGAPPPPPPAERSRLPAEDHQAARDELHWESAGLPFPMVLSWISQQAEVGGRTVVDKTGLNGGFDCVLTWTRDSADSDQSSFFTALESNWV